MAERVGAGQVPHGSKRTLHHRQHAGQAASLGRGPDGHSGDHHVVTAATILAHVDFLDRTIAALTAEIDARTSAFTSVYELLLPVPGLERVSIDVIVAQTGADMTRFPSQCRRPCFMGRRRAGHPRVRRQAPRVVVPSYSPLAQEGHQSSTPSAKTTLGGSPAPTAERAVGMLMQWVRGECLQPAPDVLQASAPIQLAPKPSIEEQVVGSQADKRRGLDARRPG
jgi:hypothetical protein